MRNVNGLRGLRELRTMQSLNRSTVPRERSSTYLDLYILDRQKERLVKEEERLTARKKTIKKRLEEIDLQLSKVEEARAAEKAEKEGSFSERDVTQTNEVRKEWRKMPLNY